MGDFELGSELAARRSIITVTVYGRYSLRGAVGNAPRDAEFALSPPFNWRASIAAGPLWIQNERGFYFDFTQDGGPYHVRGYRDGVVYRNPVPELFALDSLESCLRWQDAPGPTGRRVDEREGRGVHVHTNPAQWGMGSRIVTDVETGIVLHVVMNSAVGPLELTTSGVRVAAGVDIGAFSWHGPVRSLDGARVGPLPSATAE